MRQQKMISIRELILFSNNFEVIYVVQRVNFEDWFLVTWCWKIVKYFNCTMRIFDTQGNSKLFKWNHLLSQQSFICESSGMANKGFFRPSSIHSTNTCGTLSTHSVPGPSLGPGDTGWWGPMVMNGHVLAKWAVRAKAFQAEGMANT